jgi:hypothetical protein
LQLGVSALIIFASLAAVRGACFTGEMMVETRRGLTRWDCLTLDDEVASCAEHDPHGAIEFMPSGASRVHSAPASQRVVVRNLAVRPQFATLPK